jgi:arginase
MPVQLIAVPYDAGRRGWRMGQGPEALIAAGLPDALGPETRVDVVEAGETLPEIAAPFVLAREVAARVAAARAEGRFPLVLAGNCGATLGTVAALPAGRTGVVWFDAHADFHTPETTTSGFVDGTALATLTGRCWRALTATVPGFSPVADRHVALVGARSVDPGERVALAASGVTFVSAASVGLLGGILRRTITGVEAAVVHVDLDVLDPEVAGPANAFAAPGGLDAEGLVAAVQATCKVLPVVAATMSAYDPVVGTRGRVAPVACAVARVLGAFRDP